MSQIQGNFSFIQVGSYVHRVIDFIAFQLAPFEFGTATHTVLVNICILGAAFFAYANMGFA